MKQGPDRKRIFFATIAAGGSHVSTAQAMAEALERHHPGEFTTTVSDVMAEFGFEGLDRHHKRIWKAALRNPWTIVAGQRLIDALPRLSVAFHRWLLRGFAKRAAERFRREPVDLIVVNHGWLAVAFALARTRYGLDLPVVTFETSTLNANGLWADGEAERFVVASSISQQRLVRLGIPSERIDVVGYPVRQAFIHAPDKRSARKGLGLDDTFTCLMVFGGEGVGGSPETLVQALRSFRSSCQLIAIAGRNQELRSRLESLRNSVPELRVEGFTEQVATYLAASDVVVGKTGPATVFETLAVGRPVIATHRFGDAENKLIELLTRQDLGHFAPDGSSLLQRLRRYRSNPELLVDVERKTRSLDFEGMSMRLAHYLANYARFRRPLREAVGLGISLLR